MEDASQHIPFNAPSWVVILSTMEPEEVRGILDFIHTHSPGLYRNIAEVFCPRHGTKIGVEHRSPEFQTDVGLELDIAPIIDRFTRFLDKSERVCLHCVRERVLFERCTSCNLILSERRSMMGIVQPEFGCGRRRANGTLCDARIVCCTCKCTNGCCWDGTLPEGWPNEKRMQYPKTTCDHCQRKDCLEVFFKTTNNNFPGQYIFPGRCADCDKISCATDDCPGIVFCFKCNKHKCLDCVEEIRCPYVHAPVYTCCGTAYICPGCDIETCNACGVKHRQVGSDCEHVYCSECQKTWHRCPTCVAINKSSATWYVLLASSVYMSLALQKLFFNSIILPTSQTVGFYAIVVGGRVLLGHPLHIEMAMILGAALWFYNLFA